MTSYQSQYFKSLNIEVNIMFDSDISNGSNYCVINNMKDILLGEFSNEEIYSKFLRNYKSENVPLHIINESFYLDKRVLDAIRKTTISFPSYSSGGNRSQIRSLITNYDKFRNNKKIEDSNKNILLPYFKNAFFSGYRKDPKIVADVKNIKTLEVLFSNDSFLKASESSADPPPPVIGTQDFHNYMKETYYKATTTPAIKSQLEEFYNMTINPLINKFKYEYFLNAAAVTEIYTFINKYSSEDTKYPINTNEKKEDIYNKYLKYVFPNKKDVSFLNDIDKDIILMFNNVFYILQNIYLYDDTIIQVNTYGIKKKNDNQKKKYYISNVKLLDLNDNTVHFEIRDNKVIIFIRATLKPIIENPTLQIGYLIDDLENPEQQFSQQISMLQPKDINAKYSIYNKIYIHDSKIYIKNSMNIDKLYKFSLNKKYIENKEETFLSVKTLALFPDYLTADISRNTTIESNIKFLLHKIFKFYNNKKIKNYYIKDTYIKYADASSKYYSITKDSIIDNISQKYNAILEVYKINNPRIPGWSKIRANLSSMPAILSSTPEIPVVSNLSSLFTLVPSPDARLKNNKIYKIFVVFRCYLDNNGNKPTFMRKLIAENCLPRAQILDNAFSNILYKTFDLPQDYLYKKLSNITKKQKVIVKNKSTKEPTKEPTKESSKEPTKESSKEPTKEPSKEPSKESFEEPPNLKVGGNLIKKNKTRKQYPSITNIL